MEGDLASQLQKAKEEIVFLKSVLDTHYSSLVSNLRIKQTKDGSPVWIDIQNLHKYDLSDIVMDDEIKERTIVQRYRDRDY